MKRHTRARHFLTSDERAARSAKIVRLYCEHGLSTTDIGQRLGISTETACKALRNAGVDVKMRRYACGVPAP